MDMEDDAERRAKGKAVKRLDFNWRGKVRVEKHTRGDGKEFFSASVRVSAVDGLEWWKLRERDPQSGKDVTKEFASAPAAMSEAQRVWKLNYDKKIVKTVKVF